jgi:site-specific recombinase XerD
MAELDDLVQPWLSVLEAHDRSQRTVTRYRAVLKRFLMWYESEERRALSLTDLTPIALQGYRRTLQKTEATSTVNIHVCALRAWCEWLATNGHLTENPALHLRQVRTTTAIAPRGLSDSEVNALLREAQRSRHPVRDYAVLQVMLQTGIRIGECAALSWRDISFGEKSGSLCVRAGKGDKARTVPLNSSARSALAAYIAPLLQVDATLRAVAQAWPSERSSRGNDPLWQSQMGGLLSESGIWRMMSGLVKLCAARNLLPADISPHDLRHTFAHRYLDEHSGDLVGLARLLGHSSLDTTAIYTQPSEEELAERVENSPLNAYGTTRKR